MKLVRCQKCKKMYELISINNKYCPDCTRREYERYISVRTYVKENPGITVTQVSEDLGINVSVIIKYLKEEKLEISGNSNTFLRCQSCGEQIKTGTHCSSCKRNLSTEQGSSVNINTQSTDNVGMMFTAKK